MQLIGYMDSPYVRRTAISARCLGIDYEHRELSIFREYDAFREINPLVKVPTLICDDGQWLVDSGLIIDYLESLTDSGGLLPGDAADRVRALHLTGTALVAMEKTVGLIYELRQRPEETQFRPWADRLRQQLREALTLLDAAVGDGSQWLFGDPLSRPDIDIAVAWRFVGHQFPEEADAQAWPGLARFSARAELTPAFLACPIA